MEVPFNWCKVGLSAFQSVLKRFFFPVLVFLVDAIKRDDDELRLVSDIFNNYSREVRPVKNKDAAIKVIFGIAYTQLVELVSKKSWCLLRVIQFQKNAKVLPKNIFILDRQFRRFCETLSLKMYTMHLYMFNVFGQIIHFVDFQILVNENMLQTKLFIYSFSVEMETATKRNCDTNMLVAFRWFYFSLFVWI